MADPSCAPCRAKKISKVFASYRKMCDECNFSIFRNVKRKERQLFSFFFLGPDENNESFRFRERANNPAKIILNIFIIDVVIRYLNIMNDIYFQLPVGRIDTHRVQNYKSLTRNRRCHCSNTRLPIRPVLENYHPTFFYVQDVNNATLIDYISS